MVKKLVSVFCICAYFGLAHAQIPQEIWKESEQIENKSKRPLFPIVCTTLKISVPKKEIMVKYSAMKQSIWLSSHAVKQVEELY